MTQIRLPFSDRASETPVAEGRAPGPPVAAPAPAEPRSSIAYVFVRSPRARKYILRVRPDGVVRVTIPPRGSKREALQVVERHRSWIERQWRQRVSARLAHEHWSHGTPILFRGQEVTLAVRPALAGATVGFADQAVHVPGGGSVRKAVERQLRSLAERELEPRLREFAGRLGLAVERVTVRDQRTRWGSCSRQGNISLNWRLVQMPPFVSDYILMHELVHLRHANHSRGFWREVGRVCPDFREAEAWLRKTGESLW
jgi:hypothetical protein